MKQRCCSQSAFVNLRVLIGLFIVLAGASLALLGSGALAASSPSFVEAQQKYSALNYGGDPLVPAGFDCSKIHELGIDKQESLRAGAIMIFCGEAQDGEPGEAPSSSAFSKLVQKLTAPIRAIESRLWFPEKASS
jgi:hypothetical protein